MSKSKLALIVLGLSILLTSCSEIMWDTHILYNFDNFKCSIPEIENKLLNKDIENSIEEKIFIISVWVGNNIIYVHDIDNNKIKNHYQDPMTTLKNKKGDCEDLAILLIAITYYYLHIKMDLAQLDNPGHMIAIYNGLVYESDTKNTLEYYLTKTKKTYINTINFKNIPNLILKVNESNDYSEPGVF